MMEKIKILTTLLLVTLNQFTFADQSDEESASTSTSQTLHQSGEINPIGLENNIQSNDIPEEIRNSDDINDEDDNEDDNEDYDDIYQNKIFKKITINQDKNWSEFNSNVHDRMYSIIKTVIPSLSILDDKSCEEITSAIAEYMYHHPQLSATLANINKEIIVEKADLCSLVSPTFTYEIEHSNDIALDKSTISAQLDLFSIINMMSSSHIYHSTSRHRSEIIKSVQEFSDILSAVISSTMQCVVNIMSYNAAMELYRIRSEVLEQSLAHKSALKPSDLSTTTSDLRKVRASLKAISYNINSFASRYPSIYKAIHKSIGNINHNEIMEYVAKIENIYLISVPDIKSVGAMARYRHERYESFDRLFNNQKGLRCTLSFNANIDQDDIGSSAKLSLQVPINPFLLHASQAGAHAADKKLENILHVQSIEQVQLVVETQALIKQVLINMTDYANAVKIADEVETDAMTRGDDDYKRIQNIAKAKSEPISIISKFLKNNVSELIKKAVRWNVDAALILHMPELLSSNEIEKYTKKYDFKHNLERTALNQNQEDMITSINNE